MLISFVLSVFRKHYVEAELSVLTAIPLAGWFSTILKNVFKHGDEVIDGVEFVAMKLLMESRMWLSMVMKLLMVQRMYLN